ncbi:MAG: BolA family transcriptional regulator [Legionellales bacterium]|nr:BolA family transcriptional regulator [Legionellales bacterium]|tara:strand:+ start:2268 stop:2525 length:258 start_codon:yes stop_codon:yes gene_type:complete
MIDPRITALKDKLNSAFKPSFLDIIDDSHLHVGHAGAEDNKLHITIRIKAKALDNLKRIQQHKMIYSSMSKEIESHFHAISITIL